MEPRVWIGRALCSQLGSLLLAVTTGMLGVLLTLAGDAAGAAALRALTYLAGGLFAASHITLVVLLAWRELDRERGRP